MSYRKLAWVTLAALGLSACGQNDYTPATGVGAGTIFAEACASCHGAAGTGKFGFLLKLAGSEQPHLESEVAAKVINGGHIMPAFPNIDQKNAEALGRYINSL
ncbi:MAG: cytochrome c [Candidatus Polarisedimenticolaceae bacterium]|nr:cytochrome c [Candidatus Polarisedimenticolaceae bacterium]